MLPPLPLQAEFWGNVINSLPCFLAIFKSLGNLSLREEWTFLPVTRKPLEWRGSSHELSMLNAPHSLSHQAPTVGPTLALPCPMLLAGDWVGRPCLSTR